MALKRDSDFAAYISIGAIGSAAVAEHLRHKHGHTPIELERYSMANKIWRTRVKRLRVPDLVCTACGRRIESRAKQAQLGIILSDSTQSGRGWDHGGMREQDLYVFVAVEHLATTVGTPTFSTQAELRSTLKFTKRSGSRRNLRGLRSILAVARVGPLCFWHLHGSRRTWQPRLGCRRWQSAYLLAMEALERQQARVSRPRRRFRRGRATRRGCRRCGDRSQL